MEIVESEDAGHHRWLRWVGLKEPPPDPDSWVPVARGFRPDAAQGPSPPEAALAADWASSDAVGLVDALSHAGIEARQRPYSFSGISTGHGGFTMDSGAEVRIGVLVHNRDRSRAAPIVAEFKRALDETEERSYATLTDEELARQAMAPPELAAGGDATGRPPTYAQWQPHKFADEDPKPSTNH